ncbi:glyoxalase/bleomycin resistance/dioxygenase family protein [Pseudoflavonifractor sp. 524-17]|uniref:VOC family protein n=1 Tax=Pseudoflavonifractor sp. 524-17 TaxID=2304577 RepID=UPI00137B1B12|nr:VOC family protein [Pseudoflavonifractor sp. 524-17]NCE63126.1 glyoxalase/bleomycin resistance/dioxygenase family protein [Pseudoflavonifractor sp. 524-17]
MKFSCPLYAVRSIAAARTFYEQVLGQTVVMDAGTNLSFAGGFALQEDFPGLCGFPAEKLIPSAHNAELYFETEDLEGDMRRLSAAGVTFLHGPKEYPWGQCVARFYDPDGHIVEVGESMSSVVLRFLSQGLTEEETARRTQHPLEFVRACRQGRI